MSNTKKHFCRFNSDHNYYSDSPSDDEEDEVSDESDEPNDDAEAMPTDKDVADQPPAIEVDDEEELITEEPFEDQEADNSEAAEEISSDEEEDNNEDESAAKERRRIVILSDSEEENVVAQSITDTQRLQAAREVDDLLDLCSDSNSFAAAAMAGEPPAPVNGLFEQQADEEVTESQLVGMCSGKFFTQAAPTVS